MLRVVEGCALTARSSFNKSITAAIIDRYSIDYCYIVLTFMHAQFYIYTDLKNSTGLMLYSSERMSQLDPNTCEGVNCFV